MPQLEDLLAKIQKKQKTFSRGNRPDRIASGSLSLPTLPSENKVELNKSQSEAKVGPKVESKWGQSEAKVEHTKVTKNETRAKVGTKLGPKVESKWGQSEAKVEPVLLLPLSVSSIVGLQRKVLIFIYDSCRFSGSKTSPPFAIKNIAASCNTRISAVKKALQRLEQKLFLHREEYKDGRSGWTRYRLPDRIYADLLQNETEAKVEPNWGQSRAKVGTKLEPEPEPTPPSSSSLDLDLNKLTNTGDMMVSASLPSGWNELDTSPLTTIRFGQQQVTQLARLGNLTVEQVQESINAFAFDLEVNGKGREINGHALNYFMGILRRGPYAPATNYESPEVRQMRLYLEAKEREQKTRLALESRLETVEFDEWNARLTLEEKIRLVPVTDFAKPGSQGHNVQLKEYFRENIWPQRRKEVVEL